MTIAPWHRRLLLGPALLVVVGGLGLPLLFFLRFSLAEEGGSGQASSGLTIGNFVELLTRDYYRSTLISTFGIALASTALALVLGLAVAKLIADSSGRAKTVLIICTVFPMLVGNVVRAIGWVTLLGYDGVVNSVLTGIGLQDEPLDLLKTPLTVVIAIMAVELPMMVMVLHASMELVGDETTRAAQSLGAGPIRAFFGVTLPQIVPGVVTGGSLVLVDSVNAYATPLLVGGSQVPMIAPEIYTAITRSNDWPQAAAMATFTMLLSILVLALYGRLLMRGFTRWSGTTS